MLQRGLLVKLLKQLHEITVAYGSNRSAESSRGAAERWRLQGYPVDDQGGGIAARLTPCDNAGTVSGSISGSRRPTCSPAPEG